MSANKNWKIQGEEISETRCRQFHGKQKDLQVLLIRLILIYTGLDFGSNIKLP